MLRPGQPELQLALDLTSRLAAVGVAVHAAPEVQRLEAGTPLLLAVGLTIVSDLRARFPEAVIVADTKICDAGERIATAALDCGADVVTIVPAAADSATWQGARRAVQRHATEGRRPRLMADLIGCGDLVAAAEMAAESGADELSFHLPKRDTPAAQSIWERALVRVREAQLRVAVPVFVAGGLTPDDVPMLLEYGISRLIVGGAITGAAAPALAARQFRSRTGEA